MLEKILKTSTKILNKPLLVFIAGLLITLFFIIQSFSLKMDNDITHMLPQNDASKKAFTKYENIFGSSAFIFIGIESDSVFSIPVLKYIRRLSSNLEKLNETIPVSNISGYAGVNPRLARSIIDVISEQAGADSSELHAVLSSKEALINDFYIADEDAGTIARRMANVDLEKVSLLSVPPVKNIISLLNSDVIIGKGDRFVAQKLLDGSTTRQNIESMRRLLATWDIYKGTLISDDNRVTAVLLQLEPGVDLQIRTQVFNAIKKLVKINPPRGVKIYLDGEPVIADSISEYMRKDILFLLPIVFLVVIIALYASFKNFRGVVYPILAIIVSIIWTLGFMSLLRVPLNMISTVMPVLLVAVASAYGIHFLNHILFSPAENFTEAVKGNITGVGLAITMAGLTTAAGFASLASSSFVPIKNFGVFTAVGVFFAVIITLYFLPAVMLLFDKKIMVKRYGSVQGTSESKILTKINNFTNKRARPILLLSVVICLAGLYGSSKIKVEMDNITFFKKSAPIYKADKLLNDKLAGTQSLSVILESREQRNVLQPSVLRKIDSYSAAVKSEFLFVTKTLSINDSLKKMNKEMNGGAARYYRIPDSAQTINDYLLLYSGQLDGFVSDFRDKTRVMLDMKRTSTSEVEKVEHFTKAYFGKNFINKFKLNLAVTGVSDVYVTVNRLLVGGQIRSLAFSLLVVFLLNLLVFRKLGLSLLSVVPIGMTLILNFGIMGFLGITLNAGTAMVASVAVGIGIDYAIHFLVKYRQVMRKTASIDKALEQTIQQAGRGILYNMFSVAAGFMVLLLSKFVPLVQFGLLVSLNMIVTGFGALILIPAIIRLSRATDIEKTIKYKNK